jgi:hypothetical protein
MFDALNSKLKTQSKQEQQLFDNVRKTILTSYEQSEKIKGDLEFKISEFNQRVEKSKKELYDCKDDLHENKRRLSLQIVNLKNELERLYK